MGSVCKHYTIKQCKDFDECGYMHEEVVKLPVAAIRLEINVQQGGAERERETVFCIRWLAHTPTILHGAAKYQSLAFPQLNTCAHIIYTMQKLNLHQSQEAIR